MLERVRRVGPILLSVSLLALAFPPFGLFLTVFVACAPWLASLRDTDGRGAVRSSLCFGALYIAFQMFWVFPFVSDWTHKPVMALVPWVICSFLGSLLYVPLGWLIRQCWHRGWPWLIPLVWAGHEGFRSYVPVLAFPWGLLANPLWLFPQFVQHAAFGTVFFVSAWLMVPNLVLAMLLFPKKVEGQDVLPPPRGMFQAAIVFGSLLLVSVARYSQHPSSKQLKVTLGQPGIDMAYSPKETRGLDLRSAGLLIQKRAQQAGTELIVFPEGFSEGDPATDPMSPLGPRPESTVLMGGKRTEGAKTFQTAYAFDGKWQSADKTRLVVFGEYVPFRELPLLSGFKLPAGDLSPGQTLKTLDVNGTRIGSRFTR